MKFLSKPISALVGVSLILSGASSVFAQETPTLTVAIAAAPSSGTAPLTGVDLNALVGGTATGSINYRFYCDRVDNGTNLIGTPNREILNSEATSTSANDLCTYSLPGTYSGKVIVERAGLAAEARTLITVSAAPVAPSLSVTLSADPSSGTAPLTGVDLNALVGGTATGSINYRFYCDRVDNGTNLIGTPNREILNSLSTSTNANDLCGYTLPGTYSGKVIVERAGLFAEARTSISVAAAPTAPTLAVALSSNPTSGYAPLSGVDLIATVSGTATGTVNYSFYCDRADNGTNIVGSTSASFLNVTTLAQTALDACSYASVGTYTGKVIVERAGLFAEARTSISVTTQPATTTPGTSTPPVMQKGDWKLEIGPAGKTLLRGHIESVTADSIRVRTWGGVWTVRVASGAEIIPRPSIALFDLNRFQPGDYVGINGTIVRDLPLTIDARVIRNWTEQREVRWEQKNNHEFLKRLIKDDKISDALTGRVYEGTVGTVTGSSFTVSDRGVVVTVNTSASTRFVNKNYATIALSDVRSGDRVRVYGDVTAASTISAQVVRDTSLPYQLTVTSSKQKGNSENKGKNDDNKNKGNNGKGKGRD